MTRTDDLPDFDLSGFLPYQLAVAAQKLSEGLARRYRDEFGISVPEWRVLVHLLHPGNTSVRDIEARIAMEKSKVSRAASRLESAGLITKQINDSDRRLVQLALTEKGRALMRRLLPLAIAYQAEVEALLADTLADFRAGLDRILRQDRSAPPQTGDD